MMPEIKWLVTGVVLFFAIAVIGMSACDIRDKAHRQNMAEKGFCEIQNGYYIPCALPVEKK